MIELERILKFHYLLTQYLNYETEKKDLQFYTQTNICIDIGKKYMDSRAAVENFNSALALLYLHYKVVLGGLSVDLLFIAYS